VDLWKQQIEMGSVYFRDCLLLEDGHFRVLRRKTVRYFRLVTIMYTERLLECPAESYIYENVFSLSVLQLNHWFNKILCCSVSNEKEPSLQPDVWTLPTTTMDMDYVVFNPLNRKFQPNNRTLHKNIVPTSLETLLVVSTRATCHSCVIH